MFQITFNNAVGNFDLDVTTFQMAVLFAWNQRQLDHISYENLRLATELPDPELRRTLWVNYLYKLLILRNIYFFSYT
jgi:cullin-5